MKIDFFEASKPVTITPKTTIELLLVYSRQKFLILKHFSFFSRMSEEIGWTIDGSSSEWGWSTHKDPSSKIHGDSLLCRGYFQIRHLQRHPQEQRRLSKPTPDKIVSFFMKMFQKWNFGALRKGKMKMFQKWFLFRSAMCCLGAMYERLGRMVGRSF